MSGRAGANTGDRGETLLELLIAVTIMTIAVVAVVGGIGTSILISDVHRKQATAGATVRDYGEAIENMVANHGYVACATPSSYASPPGFAAPAGYSVSVLSKQPDEMKYWTGSGWQTSCGADTGLQQLTVQVASSDGRAKEQLVIVVRKRCGLADTLC
jgi:Tfp pilus assembly protein PilE